MENISYSTVGFSDRDIESALDAIAEAGFPLVEIQGKSPHVAEPLSGKVLSDFRYRIHTRGLTAKTMHAPSGRTVLGTTDEDWRRQEIILLKRYLNFGSDLGITDMVIHPIPNPIFVENPENPNVPDLIGESLKRSIDDLIPTAERTGVRFNLENLPYRCDYPYRTMKELRVLIEDYPKECVGLIIDTGHVGVLRDDPVAEINAAGNRLCGTHIHDVVGKTYDGDHRVPTTGWLDWDSILQAFRQVKYPGPWTFEVIKPLLSESPEEMARTTREIARQWGL